jgi:hypothetical protein
VTQDSLDTVISWGIKIDIVLASESFMKDKQDLLEEQFPVKVLLTKDEKFLEKAILYLKESHHSAVNILGLDHQKVEGLQEQLELLDTVVWDGPLRYYPVKNKEFKKWFPSCSVQLHGREGMFVEISNDSQTTLVQIQHATFIELKEGIAEFKSTEIFWIGEFIDSL